MRNEGFRARDLFQSQEAASENTMTQIDPGAALKSEAFHARRLARRTEDPVLAQILSALANGCEMRAALRDRWRADQSDE